MPVWTAIAGAVIGGGLSYLGARAQNRANIGISNKQMDFQREMSNTAYQRAMNDMRAAGLNPILAYKQGGASAPAGAGIPAVNEWAGAQAAVNSAFDNARSMALTDQSRSQSGLLTAQTGLTRVQAEKEIALTSLTRQQLLTEVNRTHLTEAQWKQVNQAIDIAFPEGERGRIIRSFIHDARRFQEKGEDLKRIFGGNWLSDQFSKWGTQKNQRIAAAMGMSAASEGEATKVWQSVSDAMAAVVIGIEQGLFNTSKEAANFLERQFPGLFGRITQSR